MHSMRDKLATAIYLDSTISKDKVKQKRKKQSHSPNETDNVLFIKAPTFQRRNELLLKRAEELEELDTDDAADIVAELPKEIVEEVISEIPKSIT